SLPALEDEEGDGAACSERSAQETDEGRATSDSSEKGGYDAERGHHREDRTRADREPALLDECLERLRHRERRRPSLAAIERGAEDARGGRVGLVGGAQSSAQHTLPCALPPEPDRQSDDRDENESGREKFHQRSNTSRGS